MRARLLLPAVALLCTGCPRYWYAKAADPVEKTVALVQSSPEVAAAVGDDPSVSLAVSKELSRDFFPYEGRDRVALLTWVTGSKGEAWLRVDAVNVDEQGWAGTFEVRVDGKQVLVDGQYVTEGGGTVLKGTFEPDGTPVVEAAADLTCAPRHRRAARPVAFRAAAEPCRVRGVAGARPVPECGNHLAEATRARMAISGCG